MKDEKHSTQFRNFNNIALDLRKYFYSTKYINTCGSFRLWLSLCYFQRNFLLKKRSSSINKFSLSGKLISQSNNSILQCSKVYSVMFERGIEFSLAISQRSHFHQAGKRQISNIYPFKCPPVFASSFVTKKSLLATCQPRKSFSTEGSIFAGSRVSSSGHWSELYGGKR